jgi:hypothetical protein
MLKAGRPISTGDIEGFRDVKVLPVDNARGRFNRDLNYKLHVLRTAILACLLEEEDNSTNRVIREALEDILSDTNLPEGQYGRFFRELSKRETAGTPSGDIAKRLSYFVNEIKAISLINTLFQEWKRDEKFWTYA